MFMAAPVYYKDSRIEIMYVQKSRHYSPSHNNPYDFQIILVLEGTLEISIKDNTRILQNDDQIVILPGQTHSEKAEHSIKALILSINKDALASKGAEVLNVIDCVSMQLLQEGLVRKEHIVGMNWCVSEFILSSMNSEEDCPQFIVEARELMAKRTKEGMSISDLAEYVNVCPGYLARRFKQEIGLSPHQFQIQNRVRKSIWPLIETSATLGDISKQNGFYDKNHLKRHFRHFLGLTPNEFRQAFQNAKRLLVK